MSCINCGKEIVSFEGRSGPKPKYCSNYCRGRYRYLYPEKVGRAPADKKVCLVCGATFASYSKKQRFCSVNCRGASKRTLKGTTRKCVVCGNAFEPKHRDSKCCSSDCQIVLTNRKLKANGTRTKKTLKKDCVACGGTYYVSPFHGYSMYCSKTCADKAWRHKKRATKASAESEYYSIQEIHERDGWHCQICGKKVNPELKWPDTKSASIDHIIPLSKGGSNKKDNVQLAHLGCNSKKKNKQIIPNDKGQLMLV